MPKHVREKLLRSMVSARDSVFEAIYAEHSRLTDDEEESLRLIYEDLNKMMTVTVTIVKLLEARDEAHPIPRAVLEKKSFTWNDHEAKAKLAKLNREIEKILLRLHSS